MTSVTNHTRQLTAQELLEKRRSTLIQRTRAARLQLDSLSLLDSSYDACRQTLRQWRTDMLEQINTAHATSVSELNTAYDQLVRFRSTIASLLQEHDENEDTLESNQLVHIESSLNTLRNAEFTFDFDRASQLEGELKLIKMAESRPSTFRSLDESLTQCRILVAHDRYISEVFFQDEFITKIDHQTPECVLICPFDLLGELLANDEEVRILIDQTYLPTIGIQATRMRVDYDLVLLQPAHECCPQSSERVIRIICTDQNKLLQCLKEIYTICSQQPPPAAFNPYVPVNYNRSKVHSYFGYLETVVPAHSSPKSDTNKISPLLSMPLSIVHPISTSSIPSTSSSNHFDRVLMPVSIRQSLPITDMQAGALLGPKGERIQQLQRETGAIVNIGDLNDESSERRRRIVYVQGSQQQVNNALQAIRRLISIGNGDDEGGEDSSKRDGKSKKM